jgi:hypothetical protein
MQVWRILYVIVFHGSFSLSENVMFEIKIWKHLHKQAKFSEILYTSLELLYANSIQQSPS